MLIAQISDLHCRAPDAAPSLGADTNKNIMIAVAQLNSLHPRPEVVIATGDLTSAGRPEQYMALKSLLSRLEIPLFLIPGNHDERHLLQETFDGQYGVSSGEKFSQTTIEDYPLRLVAVDTTVDGHHNGEVSDERIAWLAATLAEFPDKPTLIFMHHPPFKSGIWWMDRIGILKGCEGLEDVIRANGQIAGIVCGHLHRIIHTRFASVPVVVSPSTCYAVELNLAEEAPPHVNSEPPGFMLHYWTGSVLISNVVFLGEDWDRVDIRLLMDWRSRLGLMRQGKPIPKIHGALE